MAAIDFFIDTDAGLAFETDLAGSGLGFYGASFGTSVAVGEYQDTTFVTDTNGVVEGPECRNVKWTHANSGEVSGSTNLNLQYIPNYQSTLNVRFTHTSAVKCQNVEARIYDRNNINVGASGVLTKVAEIIHPDTSQAVQGSGDSAWYSPAGSSVVVPMAQSPGESGEWAGNGTTSVRTDDRHDWFLAISANPTSIGSKTQYGLYVSLEYL
jgi:hypothetical protein